DCREKNRPVFKVIVLPFVSGSAIWNDRLWVRAACCGHPERLENPLVQELPVRLAAGLLNDNAEQIVTGVIVRPALTRLKLQRQLEKHLEQLISRRSRFECEISQEKINPKV